MREAYRLHKHLLLQASASIPRHHFLLAYLYVDHDSNCSFSTIQGKIVSSIDYLNHLYLNAVSLSAC